MQMLHIWQSTGTSKERSSQKPTGEWNTNNVLSYLNFPHGNVNKVMFSWVSNLTHSGRDKMAAIFQMIFSSVLSWVKTYKFWLRFHWCFFLRFQVTIFQHWFRYWLGPDDATSHYLSHWWKVFWRIYLSLGLNEPISCQLKWCIQYNQMQ